MTRIEKLIQQARERHNAEPVADLLRPGRNKGKIYSTRKKEEVRAFEEKVFRIKKIAEQFNKTG